MLLIGNNIMSNLTLNCIYSIPVFAMSLCLFVPSAVWRLAGNLWALLNMGLWHKKNHPLPTPTIWQLGSKELEQRTPPSSYLFFYRERGKAEIPRTSVHWSPSTLAEATVDMVSGCCWLFSREAQRERLEDDEFICCGATSIDQHQVCVCLWWWWWCHLWEPVPASLEQSVEEHTVRQSVSLT